jgi:thioesterase domain-containing protein
MLQVTAIPFVKKTGIRRNKEGNLELACNSSVHNHIQTVHAGAQFTLAETASGAHLLSLFPELANEVLPVLKDAQIRYRNPTRRKVTAHPAVADDAVATFLRNYNRRGRALITIKVAVRDEDDLLICECAFNWFVQRLDQDN